MTAEVWRDRIPELERQLVEVEETMASPEVLSDHRRMADVGRRRAELWPIVKTARAWQAAQEDASEAEDMAKSDPSLRAELLEWAEERRSEAARLEVELQTLMVPPETRSRAKRYDAVVMGIKAWSSIDPKPLWLARTPMTRKRLPLIRINAPVGS